MTKKEFLDNPSSTRQNFTSSEVSSKSNVIIPSTPKSLYILNLNTLESIELLLIPDKLSESYSQKFINETPFGSFSPQEFYIGGSGKTLSMSFVLHEDINNIDKSIYKLIDKLKSFSYSIEQDNNNVLKQPSVYFQLGNQFVGKGFINTSFNYNKPYRDGRYIYVTCSLVFTFEEEYENIELTNQSTYVSYIRPDFTLDIESLVNETGDNIQVDDFIDNYLDYDLMIKQIFTDSKLVNFINLTKGAGDDRLTNSYKTGTGWNTTWNSVYDENWNQNIDFNNYSQFHANDIRQTLINYYKDFANIIRADIFSPQTIIDNLRTLLTKLNNLEKTVQGRKVLGGAFIENTTNLSDEEKNALYEAINEFKDIINMQLLIYSSMIGAGN